MTRSYYDWDDEEDNIIEEYDDAGNTIADYTTEPGLYGNLISLVRNGQENFYHYDGQGSTLTLTDTNGTSTDSYVYSAFGEMSLHSGSTSNPFQYIGQNGYYRDQETGHFEVRTRVLKAQNGRWLSVDPLYISRDHVFLYTYVANKPVLSIDPSGLEEESCGPKRPIQKCCCCVDSLDIPDKFKAINSVLVPIIVNGKVKTKAQKTWAISFDVNVETHWIPHTEFKDCILEWHEWRNLFGTTVDWVDQFVAQMGSLTFEGWKTDNTAPCPRKDPRTITDTPGLPVGVLVQPDQIGVQEIYFAIKVRNAEGCDCPGKPQVGFAYVYLETEPIKKGGAKGKTRSGKTLPKLPDPPGEPPGF